MTDEPKKDDVEEKEEEAKPAPEAAKSAPDDEDAHAHADDEDEDEEEEAEEHADEVGEKRAALYIAEFETPGKVLHAAEAVRKAGFTKFDAHTPFPVHGMDQAMGLPDSKLGWIVLVGGLSGLATAIAIIWYMNGYDYPIVVGGKPPFAWPPNVPVMFELTVLFSCFGAVLGMFHLNKLPRHHHPIFESDKFRSASDDKFFLSIEAEDPKFDIEKTKAFLEKLHPNFVELVEEPVEVEKPEPEEDH